MVSPWFAMRIKYHYFCSVLCKIYIILFILNLPKLTVICTHNKNFWSYLLTPISNLTFLILSTKSIKHVLWQKQLGTFLLLGFFVFQKYILLSMCIPPYIFKLIMYIHDFNEFTRNWDSYQGSVMITRNQNMKIPKHICFWEKPYIQSD